MANVELVGSVDVSITQVIITTYRLTATFRTCLLVAVASLVLAATTPGASTSASATVVCGSSATRSIWPPGVLWARGPVAKSSMTTDLKTPVGG